MITEAEVEELQAICRDIATRFTRGRACAGRKPPEWGVVSLKVEDVARLKELSQIGAADRGPRRMVALDIQLKPSGLRSMMETKAKLHPYSPKVLARLKNALEEKQ